jgi:hypothetical protein
MFEKDTVNTQDSVNVSAPAPLAAPAPEVVIPDLFAVEHWTSIKDPIDQYNASRATGWTADDLKDKDILVQDAYVKRIPMTDPNTGEPKMAIRTVLVGPKDKTGNVEYYQFVSDGVVGCLKDLMTIFAPMPWVPAMKLRVEKIKVKKGNVINLRVVR